MKFRFFRCAHYSLPRWLCFLSLGCFLLLASGCKTKNLKQEIPINTVNLLPQDLALEYLQATWGETQPTEKGMLLSLYGFGVEGTKFFQYKELDVLCIQYIEEDRIYVRKKGGLRIPRPSGLGYLIPQGRLSLGQDRVRTIKTCTALASLGIEIVSSQEGK